MSEHRITIRLYAKDRRTIHASGEIDYNKIADRTMIRRNGIFYTYTSVTIGQIAFIECEPPLDITEF